MKKLGIETKFILVENKMRNTSCFSKKTEFGALNNIIPNNADFLKRSIKF